VSRHALAVDRMCAAVPAEEARLYAEQRRLRAAIDRIPVRDLSRWDELQRARLAYQAAVRAWAKEAAKR
jgi:hypothetical protein